MFLKKIFLDRRRANLVATFVVLLVIAALMIFIISGYGAKIWESFFPNGDKSTVKSFDILYNALESQSKTTLDYKSIPLTLYLKKNYRIVFFDYMNQAYMDWDCKKEEHVYGDTQKTFNAPKNCESNKDCLCLYDSAPGKTAEDKNDNVVKCYSFDNNVNINHDLFDLNKVSCDPDDAKIYTSYLIISRLEPGDDQTHSMYILEDNDTNKLLEKNWSRPICKKDLSETGICLNQAAGSIMVPGTEEKAQKVYDYCKGVDENFKSNFVECVYDLKTKECTLNCEYGDITPQCGKKYKTCEDYNNKVEILKYTTLDDSYKNYAYCKNYKDYCDVGTCEIKQKAVYTCKDSTQTKGAVQMTGDICKIPPGPDATKKIDCKVTFSAQLLKETIGLFIESYDDTKSECKKYMDENFYDPMPMMVCKTGMSTDCIQYMPEHNGIGECHIKFLQKGDYYLIFSHTEGCTDFDKYFVEAQFCSTVPVSAKE